MIVELLGRTAIRRGELLPLTVDASLRSDPPTGCGSRSAILKRLVVEVADSASVGRELKSR
jgi:hypothetical protein